MAKLVAVAVALGAACQRDPNAAGGGSDVARRKHDCTEAVARIQAAVQPQIDAVGSDARVMIDKMIPEMRTACIDDVWPEALLQCVLATKIGDVAALQACNAQMPKALQDKLQKRMMQFQTQRLPAFGSAAP